MIEIFKNYPILDFLENNFVKDLKKIKDVKEDVGDLDFLAKKYYHKPELFWIIALYNDIDDPFNIEKEVFLKIPNYNEVENLYLDYIIKGKK